MEIEDLLKFKMLSDPQISPDGKQVLFVRNTVDREKDGYQDHLCIVSAKGGRAVQLTQKNLRNRSPRWSPDGKRLLFVSDDADGKMTKLCVMDISSRRTSTLCELPNTVEKPTWSPDGKKILFLSRVKVDKEQINHKSDVKIVKHLFYKMTGTGWFQDTRKHVFVVDSHGGRPKQVTSGEFDIPSADWMPNSDDVAFVANMTDSTDYSIIKDIWIISSSKGNPRQITKGKWQIDSVAVMPKDSSILFMGREIPDESRIVQKNSNIWIVPRGSGEPANLTENFDQWIVPFHSCIPGLSEKPKFTTKGSEVYFRAHEQGCLHVFKVGLDHKVNKVTSGLITVQSFSVDDNGAIAYVATDSTHLPEIWIKEGSATRRLTGLNEQMTSESRISEPEEFRFTASDGKSIQGWMVRPLKFVKGQKYPTLLAIHGGPYSAYGFSLAEAEHEFQVLAAAGFAVFYTNPRGSLGYGEEFTVSISGHYAERDYDDIQESVDYVIKTFPFVDEKRLGVFGGSYGGYMTNWTVSHTNRFKAAITERSVVNWYSFSGVADIGAMQWIPRHDVGRGMDPWDAPNLYLEKSPIHHVKNISTPLLIIHSDSDWDCTLDHAEQLFVGLKRLNKEAKLIVFPGESHFLSWTGRPEHRVERLHHYVSWFNDYLQPKR